MQTSQFDIVLVRPSIPENIGLAARAMNAFGFERLVLIDPQLEWNPYGPACKTASGSVQILENATVLDTLQEAVADCHRVIGFSRRDHDFERPQSDLVAWGEELRGQGNTGQTALLFGPETFGLSNQDKHLCHLLLSIPTAHATLSLNLAQAVTVVLYELTRSVTDTASPAASNPPAAQDAIQRIVETLTGRLDETNYFKPGRREKQIEAIRNLIFRLRLDRNEYDSIMGMLNARSK